MNQAKVTAGKPKTSGSIFRAVKGTAVPTDATSTLAAAYKDLGYVSEDGVTNETSRESETVRAWGGDPVLTTQTEYTDSFTFTLIEAKNVDVLKTVFGETNVTEDGTTHLITIQANSKELEEGVYVIDQIYNNAVSRFVIPHGKVTEIGEVSFVDDDAVGYEVTINGTPDTSGNTHYQYILENS